MPSLLETRKRYSNFIIRLSTASQTLKPSILRVAWFFMWPWTFIGLSIIRFVIEFPLHVFQSPVLTFSNSTPRDDHGAFLESYNAYLRRQRLSVVTALSLVVLIAGQVYFFGVSFLRVSKPTEVRAYSTSVTLNPVYDVSNQLIQSYGDDGFGGCTPTTASYSCQLASATTLQASGKFNNIFDCSTGGYTDTNSASVMKYDLSSIPSNATVTSVQLVINLTTTTTGIVSVGHATSDSPDTLTCSDSTLYDSITTGTQYLTGQSWSTVGVKTYTLGSTANSDVQSRLSGSKIFAVSVSAGLGNRAGIYSSTDAASNKPQLTISYTLPPQAPTATSHTTITTSSIVWTWTDNATAETRYDVKDTGNANVTGCTNLAANTTSCTETGLSANTQYTRHPNVTDANGNTDGPTTSAYTAIQTPSSVTKVSSTTSSITVHANGTLSNLGTGQAALFFLDTSNNVNSGWITTDWTETSLAPGTLHQVKVKARNGDGVETAYTSTASIVVTAASPSITPHQTSGLWYSNSIFTFDNTTNSTLAVIWDQSTTHTFSDPAFPEDAGSPIVLLASSEGQWYFHAASYDNAGHPSGGTIDLGPFGYDATAPTNPTAVNDGLSSDATFTTSLTSLSANWTGSSDVQSGLAKYQYAIGTTSGGTDIVNWTDGTIATNITKSGLSLTNGQTYYVSVRALDNAGNNSGIATSNGITVNSSVPSISDNQTGDATPRATSGTTYDVDFSKSSSGPQLDYAQYTVYSGPNKTGTVLKDWTNIFTTDTNAFTTDWTVDFSSLQEGVNYVSVKVVALDGLTNEVDDVFTVTKDTVTPLISNVSANPSTDTATITWTTNEPTNGQVAYGASESYGNLSARDSNMNVAHSIILSGLLANTLYHFQVMSSDAAGNNASSSDAVFTTASASTPPTTQNPEPSSVATPTIDNLGQGSIIADTQPIIAGTGPAGADIFVLVDRQIVRTTLADAQGKFHATLTTNLSLGAHQFVVRARTQTGLVSNESQPITVTIINPSPSATIISTTIADGSQPSVTYKAVAPAHSIIHALLDGKMFTTVDASTSQSAYGFILKIAIPNSLTSGQHQVSLFTVDTYGRPSPQVGIVKFNVPITAVSPIVHIVRTTSYTVQSGDSLWSIAQRLTGNGNTWRLIQGVNVSKFPSLQTQPSLLQVGWTLTIPTP